MRNALWDLVHAYKSKILLSFTPPNQYNTASLYNIAIELFSTYFTNGSYTEQSILGVKLIDFLKLSIEINAFFIKTIFFVTIPLIISFGPFPTRLVITSL